jgi:acetyl esterase/lipase
MMNRLMIADARYLMAPTSEGYVNSYCKTQGQEPRTLELNKENGEGTAHWIGDPDADAVVLYCHGGGYTQPASMGHYRYLSRLVKDLNETQSKASISVLMLAYSLAPEAVHPMQLREAAVVLEHLIHDTGRSPSKLFLAGDSAGGNLVMSLLSHVLHPHPDVFRLQLESPLGGVLLLSPWVGFRTDYPSFKRNADLDLLSPFALRKWSAMFLGKANTINPEADPGPISGDQWTDVCLNLSSWWEGMHHVSISVFIWWGAHEVFADSMRELERNFRTGWTDGGGDREQVILLESAGEAHVAPISDTMLPGGGKKSDAQLEIEEWLESRLPQ